MQILNTVRTPPRLVVRLHSQEPSEVPDKLSDPFENTDPLPIARQAAMDLQDDLRTRGRVGHNERRGRGKMFGVLVVQDLGGRLGTLRGFSGMLAGQWHVPGFVPPLFDQQARDSFWIEGEAELFAIGRRQQQLRDGEGITALRSELAALRSIQELERAQFKAMRAQRSRRRSVERELAVDLLQPAKKKTLADIDTRARNDTREFRRLKADHRQQRQLIERQLVDLERQRLSLLRQRASMSRDYLERIQHTYQIPTANGDRQPLMSLYAPNVPPVGAGDCAAPKLFGYAFEHQLRPVALAEFWWGRPTSDGSRQHGVFYPSCRAKCGTILPFMLAG